MKPDSNRMRCSTKHSVSNVHISANNKTSLTNSSLFYHESSSKAAKWGCRGHGPEVVEVVNDGKASLDRKVADCKQYSSTDLHIMNHFRHKIMILNLPKSTDVYVLDLDLAEV